MENLDLQEIRGQLDEIDTRLVELFEKRMELFAEANKWELSHGGLSGRTAAQFITHLKARL